MIKSIFFSEFLPKRGPKVIHQVPSGSIVSTPNTPQSPLFDFDSISSFLIPRQEFCDRPLTITINHYRVLGYPVCINNRKYDRNEFIFNLALVLEESAEISSYQAVVRKLAKLLRTLEEQGEFLSSERNDGHAVSGRKSGGKVYALCEMILEDLNNYCECMIPIDESNTINIKLFPTYPSPPPAQPYHVPLAIMDLPSVVDITWDLTMRTIIPYIDGVNSIARIAEAADADLSLVRKAIAHLLYYSCIILLDTWSFSNIYALTPEVLIFVQDEAMQKECAAYVAADGPWAESIELSRVIKLTLKLRQGMSVKAWCVENADTLRGIDVRRLITFGVIKGFVYRVHKYPIRAHGPDGPKSKSDEARSANGESSKLDRMLDGVHCFDDICTELMCTEKELVGKLKRYGNVQIVHR